MHSDINSNYTPEFLLEHCDKCFSSLSSWCAWSFTIASQTTNIDVVVSVGGVARTCFQSRFSLAPSKLSSHYRNPHTFIFSKHLNTPQSQSRGCNNSSNGAQLSWRIKIMFWKSRKSLLIVDSDSHRHIIKLRLGAEIELNIRWHDKSATMTLRLNC